MTADWITCTSSMFTQRIESQAVGRHHGTASRSTSPAVTHMPTQVTVITVDFSSPCRRGKHMAVPATLPTPLSLNRRQLLNESCTLRAGAPGRTRQGCVVCDTLRLQRSVFQVSER